MDRLTQGKTGVPRVKRVDAKGRITLGQRFAGRRVRITETPEGCRVEVVEVVKKS